MLKSKLINKSEGVKSFDNEDKQTKIKSEADTVKGLTQSMECSKELFSINEPTNVESVTSSRDLTLTPNKGSENLCSNKNLKNKDMKNFGNKKQVLPEVLTNQREQAFSELQAQPNNSKMKINIPGLAYIIIIQTRSNSAKCKGENSKYPENLFDCVLCYSYMKILNWGEMISHIYTKQHLLNVLEVDHYPIYLKYRNARNISAATLYKKIIELTPRFKRRVVAFMEELQSKRKTLASTINQLRGLTVAVFETMEGTTEEPTAENSLYGKQENKELAPSSNKRVVTFREEFQCKRETLASNFNQLQSLKGESSTESVLETMESSTEEEQASKNSLHWEKENKKNLNIGRSSKNLVIVADERFSFLETDKICKNVKILKAMDLKFENIFEFMHIHKFVGNDSLIVAMFGIYSLVNQSVVHICKRNKCVKPLIKYTLVPEMSSDVLISKAVKFHEYVKHNTSNDVVLFCELIPLCISGIKSQCENKHTWRNYISSENYTEYLKVIEKYNQFVRDHARMIGMKGWNLMTNAFSSGDKMDIFNGSHVYWELDYENLSKYIHNIAMETAISLTGKENIDDKIGTQPSLTGESNICKSVNIDSHLSGLAAEEKNRKSEQIVLILDERITRFLKFSLEDFNSYIKIINIGIFSFSNLIDKLESEEIFGKNSLFVVMCGIFSLVSGTISYQCSKNNCDVKNVQYFYNLDMTSEKLKSMAIGFHEFVLKNTVNDRVMFCELIPISLSGNKVRLCSNLHKLIDVVGLPRASSDHLKLVQNYNSFVERHCLALGHKKLDLLLNSLSSENSKMASYPLNNLYDYSNINSFSLSDYVKKNLSEILRKYVENFIQAPTDTVTASEVREELPLEKSKSSCLEAEPNIKTEVSEELPLEKNKSSWSEAEPNIEAQVSEELPLQKKKSSWLEAELNIEAQVKQQIDRYPNQVVLVHDKSWEPFITEELKRSVEVFNCEFSNFSNIMEFLKEREILGKGSLLILMIGTYSLIREEYPSVCKSFRCKNQPVMYYIIPGMKIGSVISQVLSIQQNLLNNNDVDQVMLCHLIPVFVDQKLMECSNKHSVKNIMHKDIYSNYVKRIEEFNSFVDFHCRSFQLENLSLSRSALSTRQNLDCNMSINFATVDVHSLSEIITSKIEQLAKNIKNSSKTIIEAGLERKLEDEIIILPCETAKEDGYKAFERIVIFADSQYFPYMDFIQKSKVTIVDNKTDSLKNIITLIIKEQALHSNKTLFILFTGILSIVKKCQRKLKGLNCKGYSQFTITPFEKVSDIINNKKKSLTYLINQVRSKLENSSAFTILPPFPPSIISIDNDFNCLYNIDRKNLSKYYICTFKNIETIKENFCQYSMGLALFANYQALEMNSNNEPLEKYCSIVSNWNDHLTVLSSKEISAVETNSVSEKFKVWANAINKFLFNCLNNTVETSSNVFCPSVTDISSTIGDTINIFSAKEVESAHNISKYDHVVFVTCSEDQAELLPEAKNCISVINGNYCYDWRDIKNKIDAIKLLKSSKNVLFVIFGSAKILANEEILPHCISAGCKESLNYLDLCSLDPYIVIQKTKKNLQTLTKGIEQNYSNAKIIFIPFCPITVVEVTKDTHLYVHKLLLNMSQPSLVCGRRQRWKKLFALFKIEWEEEMYFRLRNTKKEIKDLIQEVSKSFSGLHWINILLDSNGAHIEKPRKSYIDLCKFKLFLNNLVLLAHPIDYNIKKKNLPVPAFFLHLPIQNEKSSDKIQQNNELNYSEKNYSSELPFKEIFIEKVIINNKKAPKSKMTDVKSADKDIPYNKKSEGQQSFELNDKNCCKDIVNESKKAKDSVSEKNKFRVYSSSFERYSDEAEKTDSDKLVTLVNTQAEEKEGKAISEYKKASQIIKKKFINKTSNFKTSMKDVKKKFVNETSNFKTSMKDGSFINDKIPFDKIYILCKEDIHSLIFGNIISNTEFIFYSNAKLLEIDIPGLIQRMGQKNSACLFILDIKYFLKVDFTMLSCLKNNCECPVFVQTLDIKENIDSVDSSKIKSSVMSKVMNVITFIAKLSVHLPVLLMPLFPTRICSIENIMDHKFIHHYSSLPNFYFVKENSNWKFFEESLEDFWSNALENNNSKYFEAETLRIFINDLEILIYENSKNIKFEIAQQNAKIWRDIFIEIINILTSRNIKLNVPILTKNRMSEKEIENNMRQTEKEIEAFISSSRLQSEVGSSYISTDVYDNQESSKSKGRGVKRLLSNSPLNSFSESYNKKIYSEKWRSSVSPLNRGTIMKEESREFGSKYHKKEIHRSREKYHSYSRKRHRSESPSETKIRERKSSQLRKKSKKSSRSRKEKKIQENEEKINYDNKKTSLSKELSPILIESDSSSPSVNEDFLDQAHKEFSLAGTLELLVAVKDKLGILGSAVLSLVKSAKDIEENATELWELFNDEENVILLNMIVDKLKGLILTSPSYEIPVLSKSVEWVQKLIEEAKMKSELKVDDKCNQLEVAIDLNSIAQASLNKSSNHILELIKTAFAYEGKINPTKEEIHHAYLQVCYLHFELAVKDSL